MSEYIRNDSTATLAIAVPKYEGYWEICPPPFGFYISASKKPIWLHRVMIKLFFGWKWKNL